MRFTFGASIVLAGALYGCGGGGGDNASAVPSVPANQIAVQGKVTDAAGVALANAEVGLATRDGIYKTVSDTSGNFDLRAPVTASTTVAYPTIYVNRMGYQPAALNYASLTGGTTYQGNSSLPILGANQSVPALGYLVHHAGNDVFGGTVNSQFQLNAEGTTVQLKIDDFDAKLAAGYKTATVSLLLKGVETSSGCEDDIILFQASASTIIGANTMVKIRPSSADGSYSADSYDLPLANFVRGSTTYVALRSQKCTAVDDYDDFEFTKVLITYK